MFERIQKYASAKEYPPYPLTKVVLNSQSILTKCVGKIPRPNVAGKFGVFYHKKTKCRILSIFSSAEIKLLPAMATFKEVI